MDKSIEAAARAIETKKALVLNTWAGRRYYAVDVIGETPKKARIRILTHGGVMLPGRRYVGFNEITLVPKSAITDLPRGGAHD